MKLWLDNERPAPHGWTAVKTLAEAKRHLEAGGVERASLDHDLDGEETGHDLVQWMADTGHWPRFKPKVHSGNVDGAIKMKRLITQSGRPDAPKPPRRSKPLSKGGSTRYDRAAKARHY